jgi:hypothetical protein
LVFASLAVATALVRLGAQEEARPVPTVRVVSASRLMIPGRIDSNTPLVWSAPDGVPQLVALTSWGGVPVRSSGSSLERLQPGEPVAFTTHPGHGVWMEAIVPDDVGTWYGYYHHERPADDCGRPDRQLPRIGAARSVDQGHTWEDLGIVIDAPPDSRACDSANRYVLGGVGDVSVALDDTAQNLYLFFSQYGRQPELQGVAVARLAWADRDAPIGKVAIWNAGVWLPATPVMSEDFETVLEWTYPAGTPLAPAHRPFHDGVTTADVFWGPSVHWNTYLEQYVMLLGRARDEQFNQDGIYVSFSPTLADPSQWTAPREILNGGGWYPQVVGTEPSTGTDRLADRRARLFITGRSEHIIEFGR